jgi:ABC-2 type transport system ATP-binding protein
MARRIGLAQALINDPELLILDEPTSGLDPIGTRQIKDVIRELGRMGKTILLSSHLLADVEDVCDRVSILYGGQQRAAGNIATMLARENLTQITTEKLAPGTIERVRGLIRELEQKDVLSVSAPSDKLENLFLRIVKEAQAQKVRTSGAREVGQMPSFLGAGGEQALIDSLVKAAARQGVLDELLATKPAAPSPEKREPAPAKPREPVQADRAVIDGLLKGERLP